VSQNSGSTFRRLWTKVHRIKFACAGVSVLQRRSPIDDVLLRSGDIRDQVAKLCEIAPKVVFETPEGTTQISDRIL